MGYSEIHCKLCGVTFTIGRTRQAHEPCQNGWAYREQRFRGYDGHLLDETFNFVHKEFIRRDRCPPEAGCCNVSRKSILQSTSAYKDYANSLTSYVQLKSKTLDGNLSVNLADLHNRQSSRAPEIKLDGEMEDDMHDTDYSFESDVDDEPYEYHSEGESTSNPSEGHEENMDIADGDSWEQNEAMPTESANYSLYEGMRFHAMSSHLDTADPFTLPAFQNTEMDTDSDIDSVSQNDNDFERMRKCSEKEHLAGPGCEHRHGYSGCSIGAEEMKGCNVMQCLFRKETDWHFLQPDDQDFERSSNYYLSGVSGHVPSRDGRIPRFDVERHNHGSLCPVDDILWDPTDENSSPMPFHPTCFEIFTRVSRFRLGYIDIEGLATWRLRESGPNDKFPRHPAIERAAGQKWKHVRGDEFLAANPVLIPGLPSIFHNAIETDPAFSIQNDAFTNALQLADQSPHPCRPSTDPFTVLPHDIIIILLCHLSSKAIASLRLTSRAFRHLPISLFRRLLETEMPFLWEIRETASPSIWAIYTASSMDEWMSRPSDLAWQLEREQNEYRNIIMTEMPEVWESYRGDQPWLNLDPKVLKEEASQEMLRRHRESLPIANVDVEKTNWYKLYCGITRNWKELKGLRNRERIWEDIEEIVRRMKRYREEGDVPT